MESVNKYAALAAEFTEMCRVLGREPSVSKSVLEVGCGNGGFIREMRSRSIEVWGADLTTYGYEPHPDIESWFRPIEDRTYKLGFPDESFDIVFTNQVLEHVHNTQEFFYEISRVLKYGGISINIFPSRFRLVEPHIKVPLAGVFQQRIYLEVLALLGLRRESQRGWHWRRVANENVKYMRDKTNYLSMKSLKNSARKSFSRVSFDDLNLLSLRGGRASRYLSDLSRALPCVSYLYGHFHTHCLCCYK